ncbi:MAG: nitroreductase family deazaflavin-dependent oxidoreductase [Chloroflexi bacterium]|nr:nitroreductase family deazaflavin-dependent oxidoreductase [Chloroflexota bacterium]
MTRFLRPLQRALNVANRASVAPLLRARLGWLLGTPLTGHLMLLRTRGRRTGLLREAPLGYVIRDGAVWCVAGYGVTTPWYRNLVDDHSVEVILPTRRFSALARPVDDEAEWCLAFRALIRSFAVVGLAVVGDVSGLDDAELFERFHALPVVQITPADGRRLRPGAFDPGGRGWLLVYGVPAAGLAVALALGAAGWRPGQGGAMSDSSIGPAS